MTATDTNVLATSTPRFILIDAPGCYGDYAEVIATFATLADARAAYFRRRDRKRLVISSDAGYAETHQPGSLIHRKFAAAYRTFR